MSNKHHIDEEILLKIIEDVNNKTKTMTEYEKELNINRSSIKRRIQGAGYSSVKTEDGPKWIKTSEPNKENISPAPATPKKEPSPKKAAAPKETKVVEKTVESVETPIVETVATATVGRPKREGNFKRLNAELPADLLKALKRKALEEDITITDYLIKLLKDNIESKYR